MKNEFIEGFAHGLTTDDVLVMPEPVYFGGTTTREVTSEDIAAGVRAAGRTALAFADREVCGRELVELARSAIASSSWAHATTRSRSSRGSCWRD